MIDTSNKSTDELAFADSIVGFDDVYRISEEFERDSRRYNRAFSDEQEVSTN